MTWKTIWVILMGINAFFLVLNILSGTWLFALVSAVGLGFAIYMYSISDPDLRAW